MPDREPRMPASQTSAPVSHDDVRDAANEDGRPAQAGAEDEQQARREDAAGGDRAIAEYE